MPDFLRSGHVFTSPLWCEKKSMWHGATNVGLCEKPVFVTTEIDEMNVHVVRHLAHCLVTRMLRAQ